MMYFVQTFNTYSPKNRACKELLDFVQKFERVLIKDELSLDSMIEEIRLGTQEINEKYPKLKKKLLFSSKRLSDKLHRVEASIVSMGCPDYVFFMDVCKVRCIYQFSEKVTASQGAIMPSGIHECERAEDNLRTGHCVNSRKE